MKKIAVPALYAFQFHLIARIDNTCHFILNELQGHELFRFAFCRRMTWPKNILEERHFLSQIIMGYNDPNFCVLLNLGLYLESRFPTEAICHHVSLASCSKKINIVCSCMSHAPSYTFLEFFLCILIAQRKTFIISFRYPPNILYSPSQANS